MDIVIVGAGIGGLAAAASLLKRGHRVRLRERARVEASSEMGELFHIFDADQMRQAFHDRNIAKSRNEWLYPYDPLRVTIE